MLTESEVQLLEKGVVVHDDETCKPYTVTFRRTIKEVPFRHDEAWAVSASGVMVVRITCNSQPGYHLAAHHEIVRVKPKPRVSKKPQPRRKVKRHTGRAA